MTTTPSKADRMIYRRLQVGAVAVCAAMSALLGLHDYGAVLSRNDDRSEWKSIASITPVLPGESAPKKTKSKPQKPVKESADPKAPIPKDKA